MLFPQDMFNDCAEHISVHAEVDALQDAAPESAKGAVLYVARIMPAGHWGLSKPCPRCHQALLEAGVKKVVYTDYIETNGLYLSA